MLPNTIKYFMMRDGINQGKPLALVRLHRDDTGIWADYFKENQWIESHAAFDMAYSDSLNVDEIDEKIAFWAMDYLSNKKKDHDLFFYLFNDFIGGAYDDKLILKYSKINLNDTQQRHTFISNALKPFYENHFDDAQKQSFKSLLQALIDSSETITNRAINNQLFPFDFPDDVLMFYTDIQAILFKTSNQLSKII